MNDPQIVPMTQTTPLAVTPPRMSIGEFIEATKDRRGDELKELVSVYKEMMAMQAKERFTASFAAFRHECPKIKKMRGVSFSKNAGAKRDYYFAPLEDIADIIDPLLHRHGFTYNWSTEVAERLIAVTCKLSHVGGHVETSTCSAPATKTGGMNDVQAYGSTITYMRRQSLISVCGLTTCDQDDDALEPGALEPINNDERIELEDLIRATGSDEAKLCKIYGVQRIADLPANMYEPARAALEAKRR